MALVSPSMQCHYPIAHLSWELTRETWLMGVRPSLRSKDMSCLSRSISAQQVKQRIHLASISLIPTDLLAQWRSQAALAQDFDPALIELLHRTSCSINS